MDEEKMNPLVTMIILVLMGLAVGCCCMMTQEKSKPNEQDVYDAYNDVMRRK